MHTQLAIFKGFCMGGSKGKVCYVQILKNYTTRLLVMLYIDTRMIKNYKVSRD